MVFHLSQSRKEIPCLVHDDSEYPEEADTCFGFQVLFNHSNYLDLVKYQPDAVVELGYTQLDFTERAATGRLSNIHRFYTAL